MLTEVSIVNIFCNYMEPYSDTSITKTANFRERL